ncbi:hypothetical protein ABIB25_000432 [Nakamurella sp. UYEF19]|uniref:alpha/beta hydrolase n=1 Tax=Nakamurella sp. UYEF19 TaxID=1756392 RepID=UPI0033971FCA
MTGDSLIGSAMLAQHMPELDAPGQGSPAARLASLHTGQLRDAAAHLAGVLSALTAGRTDGESAIGEISRGWSAPSPRIGSGRLLLTAQETAVLLLRQAAAIEGVCVVIDRAVFDARIDVHLALAELKHLRDATWVDQVGGIFGVPQAAKALRINGIARELDAALRGRLASVEAALDSLRSGLAADPTTGPDALRGGRDPLLRPDPVMNPAYRTDQRNRAALAADLGSDDPTRIRFAMSILHSLREAADRSGSAALIVYDPGAYAGQGRAAVAVGDLTTATNVAVVVPGIANSPSQMAGGIDLAADLRDESMTQSPGEQTAVVVWYGYDIPLSWPKDPDSSLGTDIRDTVAAASAQSAAAAAPVLAADLRTIRSMSQSSARVTVLGFSMGSTTVSEAARYDLPVDSLVLMGSPGAGWDTRSAAGYPSVPASQVYILSYDQDPITLPVTDNLASRVTGLAEPYGTDPASKAFGGTNIDVSTNVAALAGTGLVASLLRVGGDPRHHSMRNYMQGRALAAEGSIVVGRGRDVPVKPGR